MNTMAAMQREELTAILDRISGLQREGGAYRAKEEQELAVYIGMPGRAMVVAHVTAMHLLAAHVELEVRDKGTLFTTYDAVTAISHSGDGNKPSRRTNVGFSP